MKILKASGKDYLVHYSINNLVRMEQDTGKSFTEMFDEDDVALGTIRDLIYYGLISKQHKFTHEDAGRLMDDLIADGKSMAEVSQMFLKELTNSLGMGTEVEEAEGTGTPN